MTHIDPSPVQSPAAAAGAEHPSAHSIAARLHADGMRCNCDLDNWQPEASTGHSCVCRIHNAAIEAFQRPRTARQEPAHAAL